MSATICYRPTLTAEKTIGMGAPSKFIEIMTKEFGWPCTLHDDALPRLRAMANVWGGEDGDNPFLKVAVLLEHHDGIDLWAAY